MTFIPVPSKKLIMLLLLPLLGVLFSLFLPLSRSVILLGDLIIVSMVLYDLFKAFQNQIFRVSPEKEASFYMNQPGEIIFLISTGRKSDFQCEIHADLPRFWKYESSQNSYTICANRENRISYPVTALRRGDYRLPAVHFRYDSHLSLFKIYRKKILDFPMRVFPDYRNLKEYFLLSRNNRLYEMGIHKNRYKGQGSELESLREYSKDDDARFIDWKATARFNRPVTRVFQMESVNDVLFVLDCGRLMTSEENNLSSIDLAIEALLVLAHVAIKMGDRIRIITFSDKIKGDFSPPLHGNPMKKIINFLTPVQPEFVESNYSRVFSHLQKTVKKRSLIIVVTDLIDDINYTMFRDNLKLLSKKNALLLLLLKDRLLQEEANKEVHSLNDIYSVTAARSMFVNRKRAVEKIKQSGVNVLDVLPEEVTAKLVDKFMQLKADNRI